ncbi:MAG: hypothetical protein ACODAQ_09275 [Phycisphaeraceae bacterium]
MSESSPNELALPTEAIPALRTAADALTQRLGRRLNYAQTYIALGCARSSGELDALGCRDFLEHTTNPRMIETVATLLEQHPELLDELQNSAKLQGFD